MDERIIAAIANQLNIEESQIKPESRLVEDLKADSLDLVALVLELEQSYNIQISDEDMMTLRTVEDIDRYLKEKV